MRKISFFGIAFLCFIAALSNRSVSIAEQESATALVTGEKQPKVILNIAADALVDYLRTEKPLDAGADRAMIIDGLRDMVDQYQGTNVTHLCFNIGYQRASYRSDVWDSYWDDPNRERYLEGWPKKYWLIHQQEVDPFAIAISRCREKQISPWVSIRMNDTHHLDNPSRSSRLWQFNPELRTRKTGGFDFTHLEVRKHYLSLIGELLKRYDVDGIELDFMRYADYFKPKEARNKSYILTGFMQSARQLADSASEHQSRRAKLSARVPARPEFASGFGIDGVSWVQNGLVDILVPCSTWNPSYPDVPVESWRSAIGDIDHDYLLVPGTDLWIRGAHGKGFMRSNMETMRGFSASMMDRGADAIYLFNHFARTDSKIWHLDGDGERRSHHVMGDLLREAGSLQISRSKTRRHILTNHDPVPPDSNYRRPLPATISQQQSAIFSIHIGPQPTSGRISIRVGIDDSPDYMTSEFTAQLNGVDCGRPEEIDQPMLQPSPASGGQEVLTVAAVAPRVIQFDASIEAVRRGYNTVRLSLSTPETQQVTWLEILFTP